MRQAITVRENSQDYECQDCFGHELDVHGRCARCGSEAVALIFRPTTSRARPWLPSRSRVCTTAIATMNPEGHPKQKQVFFSSPGEPAWIDCNKVS